MTESSIAHIPVDILDEFEVKDDGRVICKSWTAVSRLAGVQHQSITDKGRLLDRILTAATETLPESLKPLSGMDLRAATEINETVLSCVINYYAWESPAANSKARATALAVAAIGLRAFFQREKGWEPPIRTPQNYLEALELLVNNERMRQKVKEGHPGLVKAYDAVSRDALPVPELPADFQLRQWLNWKRIKLTRGETNSLGQFITSTIERDRHQPIQRTKGGGVIYNQVHLALMDEAYSAWMKRGGRLAL